MPDTVDVQSNIPRRAYDGLAEAASRNNTTLLALSSEILRNQGLQYASLFQVGVTTSGAIIRRLTPTEYAAIQASADPEVLTLADELVSEGHITIDDPRLVAGLTRLVAIGLLAPSRPAEILAYSHAVGPPVGP